MSDDFASYLVPHQRLCLLRALAKAKEGKANDSLLFGILEDYALPASRDQVRTLLAWLEEQELVILAHPPGAIVAQITERGVDVSTGRVAQPGVQSPSIGVKIVRGP